jgi:hypothetical protein
MGQEVLVKDQTDGGQKLIDQLVVRGFPLTAAFWMRRDDDFRWYLYIVTPMVESRGPFEVYRQIRAAIETCRWDTPAELISSSDIKTLETTHYLAKRADEILRRHVGPSNIWVGETWVGDAVVSGTYLYARTPTPQPAGS